MYGTKTIKTLVILAVLGAPIAAGGAIIDTGFSYQGVLASGGEPVDATADFEATLWDADVAGTQIGGGVTLDAADAAGEAVVSLPGYFESINRDFRYQLTIIGGYAPVFIKEEIRGNRFAIGGGTAGMHVSWEVKGVRNDPHVQTYGAPVEQTKPADLRGTYLRPDRFGEPEVKGQLHRAAIRPATGSVVESAE